MRLLLGGIPLGCDNIGDEAILECVVAMLRRLAEAEARLQKTLQDIDKNWLDSIDSIDLIDSIDSIEKKAPRQRRLSRRAPTVGRKSKTAPRSRA